MKILLLFVLSAFPVITRAHNFKEIREADTVIIIDPDFTNDPFGFGEDPLDTLRAHKEAEIKYETSINRHVEHQIDTSFYISIGSDYFEVYKAASESFLAAARLRSGNYKTKHGLEIGMSKKEFLEKIADHDLDSVPDQVRLKNKIVREWIDLQFENDQIRQISFQGYVN